MSCTSAENCVAVGGGSTGPVMAIKSSGTWGPVFATNGNAPSGGGFAGVSCSSPGNCTAVGDDANGRPMAFTEINGTSGPAAQLGPAGSLNSVSCISAGSCVAVGQGSNNQPTFVTDIDGTWGPITEVNNIVAGGTFRSVSCTSPGNCVSAGFNAKATERPIYATLTTTGSPSPPSSASRRMGCSVAFASKPTDTQLPGDVQLTLRNVPPATILLTSVIGPHVRRYRSRTRVDCLSLVRRQHSYRPKYSSHR